MQLMHLRKELIVLKQRGGGGNPKKLGEEGDGELREGDEHVEKVIRGGNYSSAPTCHTHTFKLLHKTLGVSLRRTENS